MSERSRQISRLIQDKNARTAYIKGKLAVLVPSQIRALRLKSAMPRQADLAREADMQQSRISMFETPGAANLTLETLARLAAIFRVGLSVKFVPFSEMLRWENEFSQDCFEVVRLEQDTDFLQTTEQTHEFEVLSFKEVGGGTEKVPAATPYNFVVADPLSVGAEVSQGELRGGIYAKSGSC